MAHRVKMIFFLINFWIFMINREPYVIKSSKRLPFLCEWDSKLFFKVREECIGIINTFFALRIEKLMYIFNEIK
jgi:hypothetical protein